MPDISLLEPLVLQSVVSKFTAPQNLALLPNVSASPSGAPDYVTWDILKGGRQLAGFNVPGAEATVLNQLGRSEGNAKLAYMRIKKTFQGQLIHWLRDPGQLAQTNAEALVLRELQDMSQAIDLTQEQLLWNALRGTSTITYPDNSSATVNYQFPSTHLPGANTGAAKWSVASPQVIVDQLFGLKRLVETHGRVPATDAYCASTTIQQIFDSFAANSGVVLSMTTSATSSVNAGSTSNPSAGVAAYPMGTMLTDRMKDAYYTQSVLPGFCGLNWHPVDEVYTSGTGFLTRFVGDGSSSNPQTGAELFIGNYQAGKPWEIKLGKSADDEAPEGTYGKFTKTWKQHDPSSRVVLMELHALPVVYRPEQFVYVSDVGVNTALDGGIA
jgi:Phage major capsid protein E